MEIKIPANEKYTLEQLRLMSSYISPIVIDNGKAYFLIAIIENRGLNDKDMSYMF